MVMKYLREIGLLIVGFCVIASVTGAHAKGQSDDSIAGSAVFGVAKDSPFNFFTFTFKNDVFVGDDDGFTNGVGFTYGRGPFLSFEGHIPGLLHNLTKNLYIQTKPNKVRGVAYMLFQTMQTPQDIGIAEFQPDDIPYAGLLVLQTQLYSWDKNVADQLSLFLGLVGPATLAEQAQVNIHRAIGADRPEGWDFQLENEPVFRLEARRVQKLFQITGNKFEFDVLGLATAGIGNLRSNVDAGLSLRWGTNLGFSHATFSLQSDRQVNALSLSDRNDYYFYVGAQASIVANDILFDGNTFEDSHSVELEHFQNQFSGGAVWKFGSIAYVFQLTSTSAASEISKDRESFGALSVTYPFR